MEMQTFNVGDKECVALVRKLTPRECFRLMGVSDTDIDKIQDADVSVSAQYKLAGNSIVVDVLYHIFRKAFVNRGNDTRQMTIFDACAEQNEIEYTHDNPLRVVTLCSGYDSQCLALERLKADYPPFDYELIAWSEIEPADCKAHDALFPQWADRNLGDMTKIDWNTVDDFDLLFYSTPCTDVSQAGLQHGFTEGSRTRSSIIWNVRDAVKIKRPKFLCLENVKAMVSGKFVGLFNLWQLELERLGYRNFAEVLNAKDYGVPQNRERIFLVSIRDDGDLPRFFFPKPFPLERRPKDVLEENVDEKYYLSDKMIECFQHRTEVAIEKGNGFRFSPSNGGGMEKQ